MLTRYYLVANTDLKEGTEERYIILTDECVIRSTYRCKFIKKIKQFRTYEEADKMRRALLLRDYSRNEKVKELFRSVNEYCNTIKNEN